MKHKINNPPVVEEDKTQRIKDKRSKALDFLSMAQFDLLVLAERDISTDDLDVTCRISPHNYSDMILCRHVIDNDITKHYY